MTNYHKRTLFSLLLLFSVMGMYFLVEQQVANQNKNTPPAKETNIQNPTDSLRKTVSTLAKKYNISTKEINNPRAKVLKQGKAITYILRSNLDVNILELIRTTIELNESASLYRVLLEDRLIENAQGESEAYAEVTFLLLPR